MNDFKHAHPLRPGRARKPRHGTDVPTRRRRRALAYRAAFPDCDFMCRQELRPVGCTLNC